MTRLEGRLPPGSFAPFVLALSAAGACLFASACLPAETAGPGNDGPRGGTSGSAGAGGNVAGAAGASAGAGGGGGNAVGSAGAGAGAAGAGGNAAGSAGAGAGAASGSGGAQATGGASAGRGGDGGGGGGRGGVSGSGGAVAGAGGGTAGAAGAAGATGGGMAGGRGGVGNAAGGGGQGGSANPDPGNEGDGDFMVGPSYTTQPDLTDRGAPKGKSFQFSMTLASSAIFDGKDTTLDRSKPVNTTRSISVYVPAQYKDGTAAPVLVIQDGPGDIGLVKNALDNLTNAQDPARRIPPFVAVAVQNGGNDSKGSERGLEYDTMSDRYARFIHQEVLPAVVSNSMIKAAYPNLRFTEDPQGRATLGCSSGAAAAVTMAWFRPDLFSRVLSYSGTLVDQQDDDAPEEAMFPLGAWEYHSSKALIMNTAKKDLRIFLNVAENDLGASDAESTHHNWVTANQRTAAALKAKGYHYRYVFARGVGHCDSRVRSATLADALIWVWRGYQPPA